MATAEIGARLSLKGSQQFSRGIKKVSDDVGGLETRLDKAGRAGSRFGTGVGRGIGLAARGMANASRGAAGLAGSMGKLGAAGAAAGVVALPLLGKGLLDTAVRMEALGTKSRVVFGSELGTVEQWARKTANQMGLTSREATGLAAGIADLLVPIGFSRKAASAMSTDLIGLSGALAQWSGGQYNAADVAGILQGALLGETDALQSLGIAISATDVEAALLAKGQDKLTGNARKQAEAQAITAMVFAKSTDAQKAYASGQNKLGTASARVSAKLRDVRDQLAARAAPYLLRGLQSFEERLPVITRAIGDFARGALPGIRDGLESFRDSMARIAERAQGLLGLDGKAKTTGEAIGRLAGGLIGFAGKMAEVWASVQAGLYDFVRTSRKVVQDMANSLTVMFADLSELPGSMGDTFRSAALGMSKLSTGISDVSSALDALTAPRTATITAGDAARDAATAGRGTPPTMPEPVRQQRRNNVPAGFVARTATIPAPRPAPAPTAAAPAVAAGSSRPRLVQVVLAGRVVGEAVIDDFEDREARR